MNRLLRSGFKLSQAPLRSDADKSVGFIGLGLMGFNMAKNLTKNGFNVSGFEPDVKKHDDLKRANITVIKSLRELVSTQNNLIVMVPNTEHVEDICRKEDGVFKNSRKGSTVIVSSTINPFVAMELYKEGKKHDIEVIDAPVSGGVVGAEKGTLTFMVGTKNQDIFNRCSLFLKAMGKNIYMCGEPGFGEIAKVCNNLALGIQMVAISEALNLGRKVGMDLKTLTQIMSTSTSGCWSVSTNNPVPGVLENSPASKGYEGGFASELLLKDLKIAMETERIAGVASPLGAETTRIYQELIANGLGRKDCGVIYDVLTKK